MEENKTFGRKVGETIGMVIVTCVGASVCAVIIAMTLKFISWIF